ncbi:hypothetical protein NE655_14895 [Phocaeicola vulgatus]|nr:hypothetical protein [Phocaeicola vulgatus]MCQ4900589.1 hypothetical protein [Phocaeicola vulgatus]
MKELELTSNAALTDAVYETALNGSFLEVKLVAGSVGDDEPRGMQPEYECYHISYPDKKDTILFEQPLDAADDKVWGIERSGFFNGREKWVKGFENQMV